MSWFEKIKSYYEQGLWDKQRIRNVVGKVLAADEYQQITGEVYVAGRSQNAPVQPTWGGEQLPHNGL